MGGGLEMVLWRRRRRKKRRIMSCISGYMNVHDVRGTEVTKVKVKARVTRVLVLSVECLLRELECVSVKSVSNI